MKEIVSLILKHRGLLIMKGETQPNWLHRLAPTKKIFNATMIQPLKKLYQKYTSKILIQ